MRATKLKTKFLTTGLFILFFLVLPGISCSKRVVERTLKQTETTDDPPSTETGKGAKNLGPQVFDNTIQSSVFTRDKKENELLYTVVRGEIAHLVGIDLKTQKAIVDLPLAGSDGSWDIKVSTDGILYICSSQGKFYKHLPGTQQVDDLGRPISSETYLWDLAVGKDGEVFGASYPGCRVFRYHPDDGFSDVGKGPLVAGESYVRSIVYHEKSDKIYAGIGSHAHLVELNPRNGTKREFLPAEYKNQEFAYNMCIIEDDQLGDKLLIYLTKSAKTLVYNIQSKTFEGELNVPSLFVKTTIKSEQESVAYFTGNAKLYELALDGLNAKPLVDIGTNALATKWLDIHVLQIFNSRKELIAYNVASGEIKTTKLDIPSLPVRLNFVAVGAGNRIWTGGYLGGSNATFDPANGEITSLPGLSQTESMTFLGKDVFFGIYPGARIYRYDSKKVWNVRGGNPMLIGKIDGQDRPFGGIAVEELNKVYFGTVPTYGKNGGALVEYDITDNKLSSHVNVVQNQSIISLVYSAGLLYGGSSNRGGLGIAPSETEAKIFVWDPVKKVKLKELVPVENAKSISCLTEAPDKKIWGVASGTLFIYDPADDKVIERHKLYNFTGTTGQWAPSAIIFHPNGYVYAQDRGNLYRIDTKSMNVEIIEKSIHHLIRDENDILYFLRSKDLWQYIP